MAKHRLLLPLLLFILEYVLSLAIFVPMYPNHWQIIVPALLYFGILYWGFFLIHRFNPKTPLSAYYIVTLLIACLGMIVFNPLFSFLIGVYAGWRMVQAISGLSFESSWSLFLAAVVIVGIDYVYTTAFIPSFSHPITLFILVWGQCLLTLFLNVIYQSDEKRSSAGFTFLSFGALIAVVLLVGRLIISIIPIIRNLLAFIMGIASFGMIWILSPFIRLLEPGKKQNKMLNHLLHNNKQHADTMKKLAQHQPTSHWLTTILTAVIILVVSSLIVYLLRHTKLELTNSTLEQYSEQVTSFNYLNKRKSAKVNPPKDDIRLLLFQFQQKMAKIGLGRYKNETLSDWFLRLPSPFNEKVATLYERYRYGEERLTDEERKIYRNELKQISEKVIKSHNKNV